MKSDLIGQPVAVPALDHMEPATLYINRKEGLVVLSDLYDPNFGTVLHVAKPSFFRVGERVELENMNDEELLRGKLILEN